MDQLACLFCQKSHPLDVHNPFCPDCNEPMLVYRSWKKAPSRTASGPILERYKGFLPLRKPDPALSLGEGGTPLLRLNRLAKELGLPETFAKNETANPTASFKDRGTAVAVQKAVELGVRRIGTVSTGNMAGSTAAYAAKAGLPAAVLVKEDTNAAKITAAAVFGSAVIKVRGDYAALFRKSFELGRSRGIYFMNSVDPFRIEGYKTAGFEIFEDLGAGAFQGPRRVHILVPVSAGGHLLGLMQAFLDLKAAGWLGSYPFFIGVQASGCAPIAAAFDRGGDAVRRFPRPRTIAHAISNPFPPGGNLVLRFLRRYGGSMTTVDDAEILEAQARLAAREGLFCDPAAATPLAALTALVRQGQIGPRARVVLVLTGSGLKTIEDVDPGRLDIRESDLEGLDRALA